MQLSAIENELIHSNNFNIVGTAVCGVTNYVGPMVACSAVLDYFNLPKHTKEFIKCDKLSEEQVKEFMSGLRYISINVMTTEEINSLKDVSLAEHLVKFNCANKLVWNMLKNCEVPDAYITVDKPLTEVIDTINDSVHSDRGERYVLWSKNHSLELITPKALFITKPKNRAIVTKVCFTIAEKILYNKLCELDNITGNKYNIVKYPGEEQVKFVKKYGNTIYHRVLLPKLSVYPVGELLWKNK